MKIKLKRRQPIEERIYLVKDKKDGKLGLIYFSDGFVFDYPRMCGSIPLDKSGIEFFSDKIVV